MTNNHVCELKRISPTGIWIKMPNGSLVRAKILARYAKHDLCLIEHIEGISTLGLGSDPRLGETNYAIGYPQLQPKTLTSGEYVGTAEVQVVMDEARTVEELHCKGGVVDYSPWMGAVCIRSYMAFFTTTPILGGSSGSPVVNSFGNLVGVAFAASAQGNNWAKLVPLYAVRDFLESYTSKEKK